VDAEAIPPKEEQIRRSVPSRCYWSARTQLTVGKKKGQRVRLSYRVMHGNFVRWNCSNPRSPEVADGLID
jgi:hypothetical protein